MRDKSDAWAPVSIKRTKKMFEEVYECGGCGKLPIFRHVGTIDEYQLKCFDCGVSSDSFISRDKCVSQWNTLIAAQKSPYVNPPIIQISITEADLISAIDGDYQFDDAYLAAKTIEASFVREALNLFKSKLREAYDPDGAGRAVGSHGENKTEASEEREERGDSRAGPCSESDAESATEP